jgi:Rieske Fe-S protein
VSRAHAGDPPARQTTHLPGTQPAGINRRSLLAGGAAAVVVGGALAACGDGRPARSATTPPAAGTRLISAAEVPVGGGVILADEQMVITQPAAGEFKAFSFVCTHQGCPVTEVKDSVIVCHCHGSRFSVATGAPEPGSPATKPLAARPVSHQDGEVVAG